MLKKTLSAIASVGVLGFLLYSCSLPFGGSTTSTYTNKILPKSLMLQVPVSLASGASSTSTPTKAIEYRSTSGGGSYSQTSGGYYMMKSAVNQMGAMAQGFVAMGYVVDAILSQNNLSPGTYSSESVTLTKSLYNAINAQLPSSEQIPSSDIGQSKTVTNLVYSTSGSSPLTNSVSMSAPGSTGTMKFAWSSDKTKLKISQTSNSGPSFTYAYDLSSKTSAFTFNDSANGISFTMAIQDNSSSSSGGAYVYQKGTSTTTTSGGGTSTSNFKVWGYADNNGGLVETTTSTGSSPSTYYYYEEGFGKTGTLLYAATDSSSSSTPPSASSSSWTVDSTYNNTQPVGAYGSDLTTASKSSTYPALGL